MTASLPWKDSPAFNGGFSWDFMVV